MAAYAEAELAAVDEFRDNGLIREVVTLLRSGKEAAAYLCRGGPELGARFAVAKVYHERNRRNFANSSTYQEGRVILNGQVRRAMARGTGAGRRFAGALWVDHEFDVLCTLHAAGCDVPEPYACTEEAVLMAYAGDREAPAPQLQEAALSRGEAEAAWERLAWNVETFLAHDVVHADLSAFNVLWWRGRPLVIDFPQAVDARQSGHARRLLERDLRNLAKYFGRRGVAVDAEGLAEDLWSRWERDAL
jgi:RIO kinase 1